MGKQLRSEKTPERTEERMNKTFRDKVAAWLDGDFHEERHCRLKISIE